MVNKLSLQKIISVAEVEYGKWICNWRMVILLMLYVFIKTSTIDPLVSCAKQMKQPLNMMEAVLAVGNSGLVLLILPIIYLTLMADFPCVDGNSFFVIHRIGRRNWMIGQLLFSVFSLLTYITIVFLSVFLTTLPYSFVANGWSLVVTDYEYYLPEGSGGVIASLLPANLYNQMPPNQAAVYTFLLLFLYLMILNGIMLLFRILRRKVMGFFLSGCMIVFGAALCAIHSKVMWLFPMAHSIVWLHYDSKFRALECSLQTSVIYDLAIIFFMLMLCFLTIHRYNFDQIEVVD